MRRWCEPIGPTHASSAQRWRTHHGTRTKEKCCESMIAVDRISGLPGAKTAVGAIGREEGLAVIR